MWFIKNIIFRSGVMLLTLSILLTGFFGCTSPVQPLVVPDIIRPVHLTPDIRIDQSLVIHFRNQEFIARSVVEKRGDLFDVWILTPTGVRMAHFRQKGLMIKSDIRVKEWSQIDPRFLLQDIRWIFFQPCSLKDKNANVETRCYTGKAVFDDTYDNEGNRVQRKVSWEGITTEISYSNHSLQGADLTAKNIHLKNKEFEYEIEISVNDAKTPFSIRESTLDN